MRIDSVGRARIAANEVLIGMHVVANLPHTVAYRDTYVYHDHIWVSSKRCATGGSSQLAHGLSVCDNM